MTDKKSKKELAKLFDRPSKNPLSAISILPHDVHFESQNSGENVYILLRQHWVTNVPWVLKVLIGLFTIFSFFIVYFSGYFVELSDVFRTEQVILIGILGYLFLSTYALLGFLKWYFNAYIVTDERLLDLDFHGILHHRISEANLLNIEDVSSSHIGVWQTLFGFGNVQIQTAAEKLEFVFENVPNPSYVQDKIMDMATLLRGKDI